MVPPLWEGPCFYSTRGPTGSLVVLHILVHLLDEIFDGSHHLCRRVRFLCAETRYQDVDVVEGENVVVNVRPTNLVDVIPTVSNVDTWRGIDISELNYFTHRMRTVLYCNVIMGYWGFA